MRYALPALFTILMWWFSTGLVLCAVRRPQHTRALSLWIATTLLVAGGYGLYVTAHDTSMTGVYGGFVAALVVWGWHELTFLLGIVTGPQTTPCASKRHERAPLMESIGTVAYHELAIAVTGLAVFALTYGGENTTGLWTYMILWILRLSAKINVYLGVPNLTEEFLPKHLQYLKTYFCHRPMNMFFPVSITGATIATAMLIGTASDATTDASAASATILATLMGLALVEHWFMVLPFDSTQLWKWGLASEQGPAAAPLASASAVTHPAAPIITPPLVTRPIIRRGAA
jgi:putative photosynthetic complex assembly protein 2